MTRARSPSYPNLPLNDAVDLVHLVFKEDRQAPLDREVVAKHMGYSGISGAADKTIGSIMQYGLLERVGRGEIRVSQRAVDIFHPLDVNEKRQALSAAAYSPEVFKNLRDRFGAGKVPSHEAARSYLIRLEFLERAINPIISSYAETCKFLESEGVSETDTLPAEPVLEQKDASAELKVFDGSHNRNALADLWRRFSADNAAPRLDQRVLLKGMLSKGASFEIIVSGLIGPKEIETLIRKLEIDKELLAYDGGDDAE